MDIVIKGGTLVLGEGVFPAEIGITGEKVAAVGQSLDGGRVIEATGCLVLPGGIDAHTHLGLSLGPDLASSDDFESGTIAAACGGTTTVINYAEQCGYASLLEALDAWQAKAAGRAVIDYSFHMLIIDPCPDVIEEMAAIVQQGVTSFKALLAYKGIVMLDDAQLFRVLERARDLRALVNVHAENGHLIDELVAACRAAGQTAPRYHALTRPEVAEAEATERALALAEAAGAPIYIVHITCARAVDALRRAQARGQAAFGETCPQYLLLDERVYESEDFDTAAGYVLSPPLRERGNQGALWTALTAGTIQTVGTDHCPFTREQKARGRDDFTLIPNGLPGVETRVPLLYHYGVREGRLSLSDWVRLTATNPARLFGLYPRKGTLLPGSDADLVIFDPGKRVILDAGHLHTHTDYSPYAGWEVQGWPRHVLQRGRFIVEDGEFVGQAGGGRFIPRRPFALPASLA
ncbi:MAG: dihydropyrimidinase [Thermoplasmata archaeon]|nr:MAG: dihydropyrimidinase [Thermoplasmata archaeon]